MQETGEGPDVKSERTFMHCGCDVRDVQGSIQLKNRILRLLSICSKLVGHTMEAHFFDSCTKHTLRITDKIALDPSHVLNKEYKLLPSGRRFRMPSCRRNKYKNVFLPHSVSLLNQQRRVGSNGQQLMVQGRIPNRVLLFLFLLTVAIEMAILRRLVGRGGFLGGVVGGRATEGRLTGGDLSRRKTSKLDPRFLRGRVCECRPGLGRCGRRTTPGEPEPEARRASDAIRPPAQRRRAS
ncbi:hypothetical protein N1851_031102 [Merluccius polli]|uniref:Uncharacterized protein n=1 Tax=Merluccius polli TaxID=89951 RepID=A0AA47M4B8_MERPO|nr:hypothetical protein N1851_031102 [Merluccius polli]